MTVEFNRDELGSIVLDSYELMLEIPSPNKKGDKYEIPSRGKLKNLPEALREFEDPQSAILHFTKSASYFLPRSDAKLSDYLQMLLSKVQKIQREESDPEKIRERIRYLIGYSNWSMDAVCNIFGMSASDQQVRERVHTMVNAELDLIDREKDVDIIVDKIMKWKSNNPRGR